MENGEWIRTKENEDAVFAEFGVPEFLLPQRRVHPQSDRKEVDCTKGDQNDSRLTFGSGFGFRFRFGFSYFPYLARVEIPEWLQKS